jgi:hypothetical protein
VDHNTYYKRQPRLTPYSVSMLMIFVAATLLIVYIALERAPWNAENDVSAPLALEAQVEDELNAPGLEDPIAPADGP